MLSIGNSTVLHIKSNDYLNADLFSHGMFPHGCCVDLCLQAAFFKDM